MQCHVNKHTKHTHIYIIYIYTHLYAYTHARALRAGWGRALRVKEWRDCGLFGFRRFFGPQFRSSFQTNLDLANASSGILPGFDEQNMAKGRIHFGANSQRQTQQNNEKQGCSRYQTVLTPSTILRGISLAADSSTMFARSKCYSAP